MKWNLFLLCLMMLSTITLFAKNDVSVNINKVWYETLGHEYEYAKVYVEIDCKNINIDKYKIYGRLYVVDENNEKLIQEEYTQLDYYLDGHNTIDTNSKGQNMCFPIRYDDIFKYTRERPLSKNFRYLIEVEVKKGYYKTVYKTSMLSSPFTVNQNRDLYSGIIGPSRIENSVGEKFKVSSISYGEYLDVKDQKKSLLTINCDYSKLNEKYLSIYVYYVEDGYRLNVSSQKLGIGSIGYLTVRIDKNSGFNEIPIEISRVPDLLTSSDHHFEVVFSVHDRSAVVVPL